MKWMRNVVRALMAWMLMAMVQAHAAPTGDYVLGPGDVLKISVYQNPDLTLETRISESGVISYPLLGNVKIGGLSVAAAETSGRVDVDERSRLLPCRSRRCHT